jgi:hypothetical protein
LGRYAPEEVLSIEASVFEESAAQQRGLQEQGWGISGTRAMEASIYLKIFWKHFIL